MKLTRIGEMSNELQEKLISEISRSSNSQNKVSEADFFSTHPFHIEMEKISRRIFAPPQIGFQYQTKWFYERARGQYVQEQMKMTQKQRKVFLRENPKAQVISNSGNKQDQNYETDYVYTKTFVMRSYVPCKEWDRILYKDKMWNVISVDEDRIMNNKTIVATLVNE